jgi:hypothetical protein
MGAWGIGLYSDDVAIDVRDIFKEMIGDGLETEDATNQLIYSSRIFLHYKQNAIG